MTINSTRMEKLRRARSLNDVLAIGGEVGRDITLASNMAKVFSATRHEVTAATSIKFNADKMAGTKSVAPSKIKVSQKVTTNPKMGQELSSYTAPPLTQVVKHSTVIHSLQENLYELEAALAMIRTTFSRAKNQAAATKTLTALVKEARLTLKTAYESLAFIAKKHLPDEMALLGEELRTFLINNLPNTSYTNLSTSVYVTVGTDKGTSDKVLPHQDFGPRETLTMVGGKPKLTKKAADLKTLAKPKIRKAAGTPDKAELKRDIVFAFYIDISDLKDTSGAVLAHYYVILTGVIGSNGRIRYFLTTLPDFQAPGLYSPGAEITTSDEMLHRLSMLLTANDITSSLERKPMPINTADAARKGFNLIDNVESSYVADDSLWVVVKPGFKGPALEKVVDKITNQVFPLLNAAVGNARRVKSVIKYTRVVRKGKTIIQFFLTPNKPKSAEQTRYSINAEQLLELKEQLGIPSHVMDDIKKVLKRHI